MKKVSILFISLLMSSMIYAQNFNGGLLTGIAATQVEGDGLGGFNKAGGIIGAFVTIPFAGYPNLNAQFEIQYIGKGSQSNSRKILQYDSLSNANPNAIQYYYKMQLHYLEIPLYLSYKNKQFIYEFGASWGRLVGARIFDTYGELDQYALGSPQRDPFNKNELAGLIGLGHRLGEHFFMNWRFSTSILPIRGYYFNPTKRWMAFGQYNTCMEFTLRYYIGKNKPAVDRTKEKDDESEQQ